MTKYYVLILVILSVSLAAAQPPALPLILNGTVEIDGNPAPAGTLVTAEMDGTEVDYTLTEPGRYAFSISGMPGDEGKDVKFYVDGILTDQSAEWESGGIVNLDIMLLTEPGGEATSTSTSTTTTTPTTIPSTTVSSTSTSSTSTIPPATTTAEATTTLSEMETTTLAKGRGTTTSTLSPTSGKRAESTSQELGGFNPKILLVASLVVVLIVLLALLITKMKRR